MLNGMTGDQKFAILFFGTWIVTVFIFYLSDIIDSLFGRVAKNKLAEAELVRAKAELAKTKMETGPAQFEYSRTFTIPMSETRKDDVT